MTELEKQFEGAFAQAFALRRWHGYHTHNSRHSVSGFPDWVLVRQPRILFVELKTDTGKISPDQQQWLGELAHCETHARWLVEQVGLAGVQPIVEVHVWRPADWDQIVETLR